MLISALLATVLATAPPQHCLSNGGATVCIDAESGDISSLGAGAGGVVHPMLPGSGTTLAGCTTLGTPIINSNTTGRFITVRKNMQCPAHLPGSATNNTATVQDVFSEDSAHGSIRWTCTITSNASAPWSADIVAGLGYADWNSRGWYTADSYNAVYGQQVSVPGKFKKYGQTSSA
eukprot:gene24609-20884_t